MNRLGFLVVLVGSASACGTGATPAPGPVPPNTPTVALPAPPPSPSAAPSSPNEEGPTCEGVAKRYAPFRTEREELVAAPASQAAVGKVTSAFLAEHQNQGDCEIDVNDGYLLVMSCWTYYSVSGSPRAGDDVSFVFRRTGEDAVELLAPEVLLAKPEGDSDVCTRLPVIAPTPEEVVFREGFGGTNGMVCDQSYKAIAERIGCGPLAPYAGKQPFEDVAGSASAPRVRMHERLIQGDGLWLTLPAFTDVDPEAGVAKMLNDDIARVVDRYRTNSWVNAHCELNVNDPLLVSILCSGNVGEQVYDGITAVLGPAAGEDVAARWVLTEDVLRHADANAVQRIAQKCAGPFRASTGSYDFVLKRPPPWTADDLGFAFFDADSLWFYGPATLTDADGRTERRMLSCIVPVELIDFHPASLNPLISP